MRVLDAMVLLCLSLFPKDLRPGGSKSGMKPWVCNQIDWHKHRQQCIGVVV